MTDINTNDVALGARRRLRALRTSQGISVERLAAAIQRSPSSVRAHENGQNGISPQAAALYAQALGSSPSYILYGEASEAPEIPAASARSVPIVGELAGERWLDSMPATVLGHVYVNLPEYNDIDLAAYLVLTPKRFYRKGDYVVAAPVSVGVRASDHVVVIIQDDWGRAKLTLMEVQVSSAGLALNAVVGGADRLGVRTHFNRETSKDRSSVSVVGVVVAYGGQDRPATGPIIPPERFGQITKLG